VKTDGFYLFWPGQIFPLSTRLAWQTQVRGFAGPVLAEVELARG